VMCGGTSVMVLFIIVFYRSTKLWHPREGKLKRVSVAPTAHGGPPTAGRLSVPTSRRPSSIPEGVLFDGPLPAQDIHEYEDHDAVVVVSSGKDCEQYM